MRKGYYHGEKSVGLGPIVLVLSTVTAIGLGTLYAVFSHQVANVSNDDSSAQTQAAPPQTHLKHANGNV